MISNIDEILNSVSNDIDDDCFINPNPEKNKKPKSKINLSEFISKKKIPYQEFNSKKENELNYKNDKTYNEDSSIMSIEFACTNETKDSINFKENIKPITTSKKISNEGLKKEIPFKEPSKKVVPQLKGK